MAKLKTEIDQFIYHQNPTNNSSRIEYFYTILGDHDFIDEQSKPRAKTENELVVAKCTQYGNNPKKYFVKVGAHGKLYNPIGLYSEGNNNKFMSKIGRKEWEFREVNQQIFDLYSNFLTTKNIAWLNNAEREMF